MKASRWFQASLAAWAALAFSATCATPIGPTGGAGNGGSVGGGGAGGGGAGGSGAGSGGGGGIDFDAEPPGDARPDVDLMPDAACISETSVAEKVPLDMLLLLDRSSSMTSSGKWDAAVDAIKGFADTPGVAGMLVGLQFFPPLAGDQCSPPVYENLAVPIDALPANASLIKAAVVNADATGGSTPMRPGLEGALGAMVTHLVNTPNHEGIVILVTDGDPTGCTQNAVSNVVSVAEAFAMASPAVKTFVIGMTGANFSSLDDIAQGGGTDQAFDVGDGQGAALALVDALEEIRTKSVSCIYVLPLPSPEKGTLDPSSVEVSFIPGLNEPPIDIPQVSGEAACGEISGGWYYDDPAMPTQILLCPATCDLVQTGTENAQVSVLLGCIIPPPN